MTDTETVSTERLRELVRLPPAGSPIRNRLNRDVTAALTELLELRSRTHEPAEWQALMDRMEVAAKNVERHAKGKCWPGDNDYDDAAALLREGIAALRATPPAPERSKEEVGVKVRALEWVTASGGDEVARCAVGVYGVGQGLDFINCLFRSANDDLPDIVIYHGDNRRDAKAAAQADYEQRIRSALEPIPLHKGVTVGAMTVIDPEQWEPCSPSYLERGGKCDAPRVWNEAEQDHWHPRLPASPQPVTPSPEEGVTHRHKKRGTDYVLIGIGKMQAENWHDMSANPHDFQSVDMREVAIYRSATDPTEIWVRSREEFEDGRFEDLRQKGERG